MSKFSVIARNNLDRPIRLTITPSENYVSIAVSEPRQPDCPNVRVDENLRPNMADFERVGSLEVNSEHWLRFQNIEDVEEKE